MRRCRCLDRQSPPSSVTPHPAGRCRCALWRWPRGQAARQQSVSGAASHLGLWPRAGRRSACRRCCRTGRPSRGTSSTAPCPASQRWLARPTYPNRRPRPTTSRRGSSVPAPPSSAALLTPRLERLGHPATSLSITNRRELDHGAVTERIHVDVPHDTGAFSGLRLLNLAQGREDVLRRAKDRLCPARHSWRLVVIEQRHG